MRKIFLINILLMLVLVFSTTGVCVAQEAVATTTVTPLKKLTTAGRLAQTLGITEEEVQSEVDNGKTLKEIAEEHGLPEKFFNARVLNSDFNAVPAKKNTAAKKTTKTTVKTIAKPTTKTVKKATPVTTKKVTAVKKQAVIK